MHTHTHPHTHTLYTNIRDSQSAFRCRRHCCRWWPGWKHTPPGTRAWCHVPMLTRWTGCRCCWRSHHSCMSPARCPRYRTPTQRLSLCYSDPAEGESPTERTHGTNCGGEMTAGQSVTLLQAWNKHRQKEHWAICNSVTLTGREQTLTKTQWTIHDSVTGREQTLTQGHWTICNSVTTTSREQTLTQGHWTICSSVRGR